MGVVHVRREPKDRVGSDVVVPGGAGKRESEYAVHEGAPSDEDGAVE